MTIAVSRQGQWWQPERSDCVVTGHREDVSLSDRVVAQLSDVNDEGSRRGVAGTTPSPAFGDLRSTLTSRPVAVGVFGFEADAPSVFHVVDAQSATAITPVPISGQIPSVIRTREFPAAVDYAKRVAEALDVMAAQADRTPGLRKVVLGRWLELTCAATVDPKALAAELAMQNYSATVIAVPVPGLSDGARPGFEGAPLTSATLVTATPELLIARHGNTIMSRPLAGSAIRSQDPHLDEQRAQGLLADQKNAREHAFVVDAIRQALEPVCSKLHVPDSPSLVGTSAMWHLATEITGTLDDESAQNYTAAHLAQLLHPTPAVAGTPRQLAMATINELEGTSRGAMTGAAGWVNAVGDGEFHVVIRAGLIANSVVRLFAGAGIVPGSVPQEEAAETGAKLSTVLRCFQP